MKHLALFALLFCFASAGLSQNESTAFSGDHLVRVQAFIGGPSISSKILKLSSNFDDKIQFNDIPLVGGKIEAYIYPWLSAGVECTYRSTTISYEISDSTLFAELDEKLGISTQDLLAVNPFGIYKLDLPRLRILGKVNAHVLPNSEKSDLCFSLGLGYNGLNPKLSKDNSELEFSEKIPNLSLPIAFRLSAGYTYYFINNLGVTGEIGIGAPIFSIGLSGRF
jgi:hypothetical protein